MWLLKEKWENRKMYQVNYNVHINVYTTQMRGRFQRWMIYNMTFIYLNLSYYDFWVIMKKIEVESKIPWNFEIIWPICQGKEVLWESGQLVRKKVSLTQGLRSNILVLTMLFSNIYWEIYRQFLSFWLYFIELIKICFGFYEQEAFLLFEMMHFT